MINEMTLNCAINETMKDLQTEVFTEYIKKIADINYSALVKALITLEYQVINKDILDEAFYRFMEQDDISLLHPAFEHILLQVTDDQN